MTMERRRTMPNWVENNVVFKGTSEKLDVIENTTRVLNEEGEPYYALGKNLLPLPTEISYIFGTGDNTVIFKDLDGNPVQIEQMVAITYMNMHEEELLGEGYTMTTLDEDDRESLRTKYGASDWYDWNIMKYGTKWADCDTAFVERDKDKLNYAFDSAWSPALRMIENICDKYEVDADFKFFSFENDDEGWATVTAQRGTIEHHWKQLNGQENYIDGVDCEKPWLMNMKSTLTSENDKATEIFG